MLTKMSVSSVLSFIGYSQKFSLGSRNGVSKFRSMVQPNAAMAKPSKERILVGRIRFGRQDDQSPRKARALFLSRDAELRVADQASEWHKEALLIICEGVSQR